MVIDYVCFILVNGEGGGEDGEGKAEEVYWESHNDCEDTRSVRLICLMVLLRDLSSDGSGASIASLGFHFDRDCFQLVHVIASISPTY